MPTLAELLQQKRDEQAASQNATASSSSVPAGPDANGQATGSSGGLGALLLRYRQSPTTTATPQDANSPGDTALPQTGGDLYTQLRNQQMANSDPSMPTIVTPPNPGKNFATSVAERIYGPRMGTGQFVGGTIGGIAGPLIAAQFIPGPLDDLAILAAGIAGATLGGGVGEAAQQAISPYEDLDFKKIGEAAVAEGVGELAGRGISGALSAVGRRLISRPAIQSFAQKITGAPVSPTNAGNELYKMVGRKVSTDTGWEPGAVHKALSEYFGPAYAMIGNATQGGGVKIESLKRLASQALADHYAGKVIIPSDEAIKELTAVTKAPDIAKFDWLRGHKTYWQGINSQISRDARVGDTPLMNLASEAKRLQTDSSSWVGIDPKVAPQLADLNRQYSLTEDMMNTVMPRKWTESLKAKPEKAVDIIGSPSQNSSRGVWLQQIRNTKKALTTLPDGKPIPGGEEAWQNLRDAWWTAKINQYASKGTFDTAGFERMLNTMGKEGMEAVFDKEEMKRMGQLQKMLNNKNARILNQGTMLGTIGVAGGIGAGLGWDIYHDAQNGDYVGVGKDGVVMISAGVLASAARSSKLASLTSTILRTKPNTPTLLPAVVRLVRALELEKTDKQDRVDKAAQQSGRGQREFEAAMEPTGGVLR